MADSVYTAEPDPGDCLSCSYSPCQCEDQRIERVLGEHEAMVELLEQLEARMERGAPIAHDDDLRMRLRRMLAGVVRYEVQR